MVFYIIKCSIIIEKNFYLNTEKMEKYRDQMEKFYFDETKYDTYLEQLGVDYPEIKKED